MPLRVRQTETPTQKKIRELAERTPIVKWIFPSLPEEVRSGERELDLPTAMGMMGPAPIGLTKMQYLNKLADLGLTPSKTLPGRKVLNAIKNLSSPASPGSFAETLNWRPDIKDVVATKGLDTLERLKSLLKRGEAKIKVNPEDIRMFNMPSATEHEIGHVVHGVMSWKDRALIESTISKIPKAELDHLERALELPMGKGSEIVSEAYGRYLQGDKIFKDFPLFIQYIVKKYHKLMR